VLGARAAASPEPDARLVEHLDEAIRQLETLLGQTEDSASRATQGAWSRSGARSLLTRLLVLRQQVLGGEPRSLLAQSLLEVDLARRQMDESAAGTVQSVDDSAEAATRRIDEAISQIREQLVNSR
jgi:hypothetical protein